MGIFNFIVWDTECFISLSQAWKDGAIVLDLSDNFDSYMFEPNYEGYSIHQFIGKTDTEDNKIWADSSIVEANVVFMGNSKKNLIGYFSYKAHSFSYCFIVENYPPLIVTNDSFKSLKVIGNLQENPELLKGESDEDN